MNRRKRGTRLPPAGRLRLQARDVGVLRFVGRAGVVEVPEVARAFWGETAGATVAASRRLRTFTDHELVKTTVLQLNSRNRYTLSERGAAWVGVPRGSGQVLRTRVRADSLQADHMVMTARAWSVISARLARQGSPTLQRFVTEAETRRSLRSRSQALIPDGLFVVGDGATVTFALEVDLSNERPEVFGAKLAKYARHLGGAALLYGLPVDALLIVAPGIRRLASLAVEVGRSNLGRFTFFQDTERLDPGTSLERLASIETLTSAAVEGSDPFTLSILEAP